MPYNPRRKYARKRKVTRRPYVKRAVKRNSKAKFSEKVMAVLRARAETKQAWTTLAPTDFNSGISGTGDTLRLIPNVSRGTQDNQRSGDQVTAQKLTIRGIIQMLPQGTGQGEGLRKIAARLMIVTPKTYPNWAAVSGVTAWQSSLLKKGGTVSGFTGAIDDLFAPINSDAITCHYNKVFFFNQGAFFNSSAGVTGVVPYEQNHMVKFFKKTFYFRNKQLKYDDNVDSGLTPTNAGYFMCVGYVFTDGTAPDVVSTRIRLQYDTMLDYEDL